MNFWRFWPRRNGPGSFNKDLLPIDVLSHLSYMSAIATAGVPRGTIFEQASQLPYVSSRYFRDVHILSSRLNYDYGEACRLTGQATRERGMKSLLLRLSSSLASGEPAADFLNRETQVQAESYGGEYERQLESTKKWTDSYVALIVSAALIIVVAVISMMIWQVGLPFILGLAGLTVLVTVAGAWIIHRAVPKEIKTHSLPERSREQRLARSLFKVLLPLAVIVGAGSVVMGVSLGWTMVLVAVLILPVGYLSVLDDRKIDKRDEEVATFIRALGGVTKAIGATVAEGLSRIDLRSTGTLEPEVKKLQVRLQAGIEPGLCWRRFVAETGSELVDRTVRVFWDGVSRGGDPEEVGKRASFLAMKIALLRAKRRLVSSTFGWLSIPMHGAITGLLLFIMDIMRFFGIAIQGMQPAQAMNSPAKLPVGLLGAFQGADMSLLNHLVTLVIVVFTGANAFAVKAASGGHGYTLFYHLGIMGAITGANFLVIPKLANMIFGGILSSGG